MASRSQLKRQAELQVADWNARNPIGTQVRYELQGMEYHGRTVSAARLHGDHTPIVDIVGNPISVWLGHIDPLSFQPARLPEVIR